MRSTQGDGPEKGTPISAAASSVRAALQQQLRQGQGKGRGTGEWELVLRLINYACVSCNTRDAARIYNYGNIHFAFVSAESEFAVYNLKKI